MKKNSLIIKNKRYGDTPLHLAIEEDQESIIKHLVKKSKNCNSIKNNDGETPLHHAVRKGPPDLVKLLLKKDSTLIYTPDKNSKTALHWAAEFNALEAVKILLEKCGLARLVNYANMKADNGQTALDIAKAGKYNKKVIKLINDSERKCLLNLDDSSDEEDSVTDYQVADNLKKFVDFSISKHNKKNTFNEIKQLNFSLSFITHAAGLYLFYAPKVQESYYKLKNKYLTTSKAQLINNTEDLFVSRKILEQDDLQPTDNLDFLAKLRLHNRSEKRGYKNCQDKEDIMEFDKFKEGCLVKNTKLKISTKFIGYAKTELQTYFLRSELILYNNKGLTYKEIYDTREDQIHKSIFTFAQPPNSVFSYHLFGCEAIKNPAAFIHHKMVLDLIKARKMSWEDALVKMQMPMAMEGAVMSSRILNSEYCNFMPHKYLYDKNYRKLEYFGNTARDHKFNTKVLLKEEINITSKWSEWKLGKNISDYMVNQCSVVVETNESFIDHEAIKAVWGLILESCDRWYPGVLGDVAPDIS